MSTPATHESVAAEAHAFFAARAQRRERRGMLHGVGDDDVVGVGLTQPDAEAAEVARAQQWQRELFDAGLAWLDGPTRVRRARARATTTSSLSPASPRSTRCRPRRRYMVSHGIVAPTILAHGTEEQQQRVSCPGIWRGDVICCQLFSEPEAGSDLASLRTTAVRDGDDWIVTGQKVWSSFAHVAQLGEPRPHRTPESRKHRGLTVFLVDMQPPGIDVRPLRQMTGADALQRGLPRRCAGTGLPAARPGRRRLGHRDDHGRQRALRARPGPQRHHDRAGHPAVRPGALDRRHRRTRPSRTCWPSAGRASRCCTRPPRGCATPAGAAPGSVVKLMTTSDMEYYSDVGRPPPGVPDGRRHRRLGHVLVVAAAAQRAVHRIAGGSDEIQRNILAERVLGLPREERPVTEKSA